MKLDLDGRAALVTGASQGIGAAVATVLAEEGCHLHLAARSRDKLDAVAWTLRREHHVNVETYPVDLRREDDLAALAAACSDVDILVNNAGDIPGGTLDQVDDDTWRHAWELKVHGYISLTRAVYAAMRNRGGGVIVNDIGMSGERPDHRYIAGSAGNAALMSFTRALGGHSLRDGIRVVAVNPGPVATPRITELMDQRRTQPGAVLPEWPRDRPAHPREIAETIVFLASDRSAYTSGTVVTVDGGLSAGYA